jgi:hypothetical protein
VPSGRRPVPRRKLTSEQRGEEGLDTEDTNGRTRRGERQKKGALQNRRRAGRLPSNLRVNRRRPSRSKFGHYKRGRSSDRIADEGLAWVFRRAGSLAYPARGRRGGGLCPVQGERSPSRRAERDANSTPKIFTKHMTDDSKIERVAYSLKGSGKEHRGESGGAGRGASVGSAGGVGVQAPVATREPVEHVIHGDRRVDHYAWLKNRKGARVKEYLEAENVYADAMMRSTEGFQEKLYQEMLGRIQQTDLSVPYRLRGYLYYTRTEEGKQYAVYCRRKEEAARGERRGAREEADARGEEEVLLDLNALAVGHTFMGLGIFEVSEDNQLLAYATDPTGYRQYRLEVKDLRTGGLLPLRVERVTSAAWAADNQTLFYVTEDEVTKRSNQLWRHVLGDQRPVPSDQKGGIKPPLQEEEGTGRPALENDPGHKNRAAEGGPYESRTDELL